MMKPRVLVTGARGFIGSHTLPMLLSRGYEVVAVTSSGDCTTRGDIKYVKTDLRDPLLAGELVYAVKPTHLLHLAWVTEHGAFWTSPENSNWVLGSLALYRAFAAIGGQRVLTAGTCAEYDWEFGRCVESDTPLIPATPYGKAKLKLFRAQDALFAESGISTAWGRVFLCYGPHEDPKRFVPSVITSLLRGEEAKCSSGEQQRDFLHARDLASAFVHLLDTDVTGAVNIASGQPIPLANVATRIANVIGRPDLLRLGAIPPAPNDTSVLYGDVRRLTEEAGWRPEMSLEQGLRQTVEWWARSL